MKYLKIFLIILWVLSTAMFVVGSLTPLEFRSKIIAYLSFFIAFNGVFALRFLLSDYYSLKSNLNVIGFIASICLAITYSFIPGADVDWKTQEIMYRKKDKETTVIVFQMVEEGNSSFDHRMVKLTRVTPIFNWAVELANLSAIGNGWVKVNEHVNEMGIDKTMEMHPTRDL